jgi:hypothetical protein
MAKAHALSYPVIKFRLSEKYSLTFADNERHLTTVGRAVLRSGIAFRDAIIIDSSGATYRVIKAEAQGERRRPAFIQFLYDHFTFEMVTVHLTLEEIGNAVTVSDVQTRILSELEDPVRAHVWDEALIAASIENVLCDTEEDPDTFQYYDVAKLIEDVRRAASKAELVQIIARAYDIAWLEKYAAEANRPK